MADSERPSTTTPAETESIMARLFRNPLVVGLALLGTVGAAFQVAGVTSMLLANIILGAGIWVFATLEVWCSKWIKKTGLYASGIVLLCSGLSGTFAVGIAEIIATLRIQQAAAMTSSPGIAVDPERLSFSASLPRETYSLFVRSKTDSDAYSVQVKMKLSQTSSSDFSFDIPSLRPIMEGSRLADIQGLRCTDGDHRAVVMFWIYHMEPHGMREISVTHTIDSPATINSKIIYSTTTPVPRRGDPTKATGTFHFDEPLTCSGDILFQLATLVATPSSPTPTGAAPRTLSEPVVHLEPERGILAAHHGRNGPEIKFALHNTGPEDVDSIDATEDFFVAERDARIVIKTIAQPSVAIPGVLTGNGGKTTLILEFTDRLARMEEIGQNCHCNHLLGIYVRVRYRRHADGMDFVTKRAYGIILGAPKHDGSRDNPSIYTIDSQLDQNVPEFLNLHDLLPYLEKRGDWQPVECVPTSNPSKELCR